jgi:hypothetical protein
MAFDIAAIKKVLTEAGHTVSEGEQLLATDLQELVTWARLHMNLHEFEVLYGLAYEKILPADFPGHPDAPAATTTPSATPETPVTAPATGPVTGT